MSDPDQISLGPGAVTTDLAILLLAIPPRRRGAVLQSALSFRPSTTFDESFDVGPIRAAFARYRPVLSVKVPDWVGAGYLDS
jgi:hypothetical protein